MVECEAESSKKVVEVVNRMHLGEGVNTHRKGKTLTSDSPGRPLPESDTSCRLNRKKNE